MLECLFVALSSLFSSTVHTGVFVALRGLFSSTVHVHVGFANKKEAINAHCRPLHNFACHNIV